MNLSRIVETAKSTAIKAGSISLHYFHSKNFEIKEKSPNNPVTQADFEVDAFLKKNLLKNFPDFGWLSEETTDTKQRFENEFVWIVDPIDGTKEFIKGIAHFTICIGLARNGVPIVGVIFNPVTKELFWSLENQGAYLNSKRIFTNKTKKLEETEVLISTNEFAKGTYKLFESKVKKITTLGSTAYKIMKIAQGTGDLTVSFNRKSEWDLCGADAILREAGGILTEHNGEKIVYNGKNVVTQTGILAGNTVLVKKMSELLVKAKEPEKNKLF
ncbi:3'(2'),5'-bisphosphate nucleotidase CysQ [bacterium]|nr:3'(2'),5'-bisphosphate nucleotidase CysQ [bacterium]